MLNSKLALLVALGVVVSGCSTSAPTSPAATDAPKSTAPVANEGDQVFKGEGYSWTLSKDWVVLDLAKGLTPEAEKKLKALPNGDRYISMLSASKDNKMLKMVGLDPKLTRDSFASNVNVLVVDLPPSVNADQCLKANEDQVKTMDPNCKPERLKIDGIECSRLKWASKGGGGLSYLTVVGYVGGKQVVFTGTTTAALSGQAMPEFEKMFSTIHFK